MKVLRWGIAVTVIVILALLPVASAEWAGDAEVGTRSAHINFSERLSVTVTNSGQAPLEVISVSLTVRWHGMPTLYRVFEGSAIVPPGDSRTFVSPPTRMPNVSPGNYSCFAGVVARGPDGIAVEQRYFATVEARQFSLHFGLVPEEVAVPMIVTAVPLAITAVLFRWQRDARWPFLRAVPRWDHHRSIRK